MATVTGVPRQNLLLGTTGGKPLNKLSVSDVSTVVPDPPLLSLGVSSLTDWNSSP